MTQAREASILAVRRAVLAAAGVALPVLACLALVACQVLLPENIVQQEKGDTWEVQGRLVTELGQRKQALSFHWRWQGQEYVFQGNDLLGGLLFRIQFTAEEGLRLTRRDGTVQSAASEDELMRQLLGRVVPIRSLQHWIRGQADPGLPIQAEVRSGAFLQQLQQGGWYLQFARHQQLEAWALPTAIRAQGGDLRLHLRTWNWKVPGIAP